MKFKQQCVRPYFVRSNMVAVSSVTWQILLQWRHVKTLYINNLRNSAIQSEEIIFILRMLRRGSLSEHNDSKSWCIDSKSWCHERQVRFLLKRETSARTALRMRAFINLLDDRHAWTDRNSLSGIDRQWFWDIAQNRLIDFGCSTP